MRSLPPDDPRVLHVRECPVCRSLLASYDKFLSPGGVLSDEQREASRRQLSSFLQREIEEGGGEAPDVAGRSRSTGKRPRLLRSWKYRVPLAAAAILLVLLLVPQMRGRWSETPDSGQLRERAAGVAWQADAHALDNGSLELTWDAHPEADAYRVVLFGADLDELVRLQESAATSATFRPDDLPELSGQATVLWRVHALKGGDTVAATELQILRGSDKEPDSRR